MTITNTSKVTAALKHPIKHAWWKESTVYQIYPASFRSSNGGSTGDLRGVVDSLDYLSKLGVDIVWLSPILQSPQVDMGYDISDYRAIYPGYGTMADHDALISGLHARGMKYVMDLVVNHTSDEHEWFKQSRSSKTNPYRDWYYWRPPRYSEAGERIPPNNWESAFSGSAWTWDEETQEYYLHLFAAGQPDLNWENPAVVDAVHSIIRFWLDRGVDGFRMDVINYISKEPGLPDGEIVKPGFLQSGVKHYACGPRLHEFLQDLGKILQEYDAFSVGEMPGVYDTKEILKAVGQDRGELAMAFQFEIVNMDHEPGKVKWWPREFQPGELKGIVAKWQSFMLHHAGWNAVYMENHDQGRTVSRYCDDSPEYRTKSAKMLASHMALQSGTIFVYQGQELAQINVPESWGLEEYKDIEVVNHWKTVLKEYPGDKEKQDMFKRQYRRIGRDNARTPMQWTPDATTYAGFLPKNAPKDVKPWMSIHPDFKTWNAEVQLADPDSAFHYWRRLLEFRKEHKDIFVYGDFEMLDMENRFPDVLAYLRTAELPANEDTLAADGEKISKCLVITHFGGGETWWRVPEEVVGLLFDETHATGLKKTAVVQDLRNYISDAEKENDVKRDAGGQWFVKLRPWEVVIALG